MHAADIDVPAGFELTDRRQRLRQDRGIGRIGPELLAQDVAHLAASAGDEDKPADACRLLRRNQRDERALAVPDQPSAS
jgi:hypothetical protein